MLSFQNFGNYCFVIISCIAALLSFEPHQSGDGLAVMDEICDNALDDDGDGLIDLNDPDCDCVLIEPISLIPNPSFEDLNCCPNRRSQLNCAEVWIQASEPTTDLIHMCDWMGWDEFPPPVPFPDGEGIMGFRDGRVRQGNLGETNWKEYAGACLLGPLEKDSIYRFEFHVGFVNSLRSPPINITFFGTSSCENLPFGVGNDAFGCPTNGPNWVRLGSTFVSGGSGNKWVKSSIEVTPDQDINAIAIGPDCPAVESSVSLYYFFDNLLLADLRSFELRITEVSHPCADDFTLRIPDGGGIDYQWYKDGIALIDEIFPELSQMYGDGEYQVRINDGEICRVSVGYNRVVPVISGPATKVICKDATYQFGDQLLSEPGDYIDTFKTADNCDSIVFLTLKVLGELADTVHGKIFEGETFHIDKFSFKSEGNHEITLVSSLGCDSLVLLQLEYYKVFTPNVFSPNEDGVNDLFTLLGEEGLIQNIELSIYDRWGGFMFQGVEWDGKKDGVYVESGVYVYRAIVQMDDGIERLLTGSVTLLH